ncbi:MAG: glycerol-3-phosphate 1-O-acyltransferase PlsY [Butyrivibrio sp.]
MERLICLIIGYVFGMFQTAYIYGRLHHIDIREHGSGNAGTTNALRTMGTKAGIVVFVGDLLKAILAAVLVYFIFHNTHGDSITLLILYTGFGTVLGHNFPAFLKFKGGKGIAATAGVIISLGRWELIVVGLIFFILTVAITRYVSLGSLVMVISVFSTFVILDRMNIIKGLSPQWVAYEAIIVFSLFVLLAFIRHKANIVRLFKGTESKLSFKKKSEDR